jgi:predicted DsbA family dithiol-disulfide isomerase
VVGKRRNPLKAEKEAMAASSEIHIDVVSDVVCPWCFIGKRNLEAALEELGDIGISVSWRPFQLDPTIPPEGHDRRAYMEAKFGGGEKLKTIHQRVKEAGQAAGIDFDFEAIEVSPNTLDAHRVIRWAGGAGPQAQEALVNRLFQLYFEEGVNIGSHDVLARAAGEAGLDENLVRELLNGDADRQNVETEIAHAQQMGVTGVPCFIIDSKYAVTGAQPPQVLVQALRQIAAEKRDAPVAGEA